MTELPKTEQELNDLITAKVNEATEKLTETLTAKHNGEMATMRQKHDSELKKAREQANLSAEELAREKIKEEQDAKDKELNELRQFKKSSVISSKLAKEGLPDFFKNDTRLLNAEDGDLDKVVKDIKKEYEAVQPKGATHSTIVQTAQEGNKPQGDKKQIANEKMGQAIKEIIGRE